MEPIIPLTAVPAISVVREREMLIMSCMQEKGECYHFSAPCSFIYCQQENLYLQFNPSSPVIVLVQQQGLPIPRHLFFCERLLLVTCCWRMVLIA